MAYESAGWFGEEFVLGSHVEYDGGGWVGDVWFAEYGGDEFKYEVPVRFEFMTLSDLCVVGTSRCGCTRASCRGLF